MRSFIRQLNMYGFRRRGKGSRVIEFVHRRFQRGNERDLATISRNHAAADDTAPTDADASAVHALQGEVQRMTTVIEEMRSRIFALEQAMSGKIGLLAGGGPQQPSCGPPLHGNPTAIAGATAVGGGWGAPPTPQWVYVPPAPSAQVLAGQPPPLFAQGANTVQGMHMSSQGRAVAADRSRARARSRTAPPPRRRAPAARSAARRGRARAAASATRRRGA